MNIFVISPISGGLIRQSLRRIKPTIADEVIEAEILRETVQERVSPANSATPRTFVSTFDFVQTRYNPDSLYR